MATPRLSIEVERKVADAIRKGYSAKDVMERCSVSMGTVSNIRKKMDVQPNLQETKKVGKVNWRSVIPWIEQGQAMRHEASNSQDSSNIVLGDGKSPIILATLSDMHIGSIGADHRLLEQFTDEILNTPNLYVALLGDYAEFAVSMRSIAEITGQILNPAMQLKFVESWLKEIAPKVAWATHDNHGTARGEKFIGSDIWSDIFGRQVIYQGNIGHATVHVGKQSYKIASSHKFRGSSMLNPAHACMRYLRMEAPDCEIAMMGDTHVPMAAKYREGGGTRAAINTGNLHLKSSYAKRHFSLSEHPYFPCLVLWHDRHDFTPLWSVGEALGLMGKAK